MTDQSTEKTQGSGLPDIREVVREAIEEYVRAEQRKQEPAQQAELQEERRRREALETKLNVLVEENRRARQQAEEADRHAQIKSELQRLGVAKVDLAFRAIKDEIVRTDDGKLTSRVGDGRGLREYVHSFVEENPELLPARIAGGSGVHATHSGGQVAGHSSFELDKIKPGMSKDELDRARQEIARLAGHNIRGL